MKKYLIIGLALSCLYFNFIIMEKSELNQKLQSYCEQLPKEFDQIPEERQEKLKSLGEYILKKQKNNEKTQVTVICTHNSRRSHMGQLWLLTSAIYYDIPNLETFSGGTEATAFNPRAVAAMQRAGFDVEKLDEDKNPKYKVALGNNIDPQELFSKKYSHEVNPKKGFAAVMVCSQADEACPIVFGAEHRVSIPFEDPKAFDGTVQEAPKYDERCHQIAREMFFVMNYVKENLD